MESEQFGSYRIEALIGRGGMGEVYLARDTRLGRQVALKVLRPTLTSNVDAVRRNAEGIANAAGEIDSSVQKVTAAARAIG